jgi:ABC-2 type transport system permease protein
VLLLSAGAGLLTSLLAGIIAMRRDIGSGLLPARDTTRPNLRLLSSPILQTLRGERASFTAWLLGCGFFAFIVGAISTSISSAGLSRGLRQQLSKIGAVSVTTPAGYIGFSFLFFVLVISLFACSQLTAARAAEADDQLETLFALPVSRRGWLAGRLLLAAGGATAIGLAAGALAWAGAATQDAGISLSQTLEAGANCLPTALLFLGIGALVYALAPRASTGINYGLVTLAFVWGLFGSALSAPHWLLELSPFQHVGFVPAEAFRGTAAGVMLAIAAAAALAATAVFRRRDLVGA